MVPSRLALELPVALEATNAQRPCCLSRAGGAGTEKADDAKTAATKEYWCRMAENWLKLAQSKERTQKRE
jgi:hypothetical protein